jgi:hypothetical protein
MHCNKTYNKKLSLVRSAYKDGAIISILVIVNNPWCHDENEIKRNTSPVDLYSTSKQHSRAAVPKWVQWMNESCSSAILISTEIIYKGIGNAPRDHRYLQFYVCHPTCCESHVHRSVKGARKFAGVLEQRWISTFHCSTQAAAGYCICVF